MLNEGFSTKQNSIELKIYKIKAKITTETLLTKISQ